MDIRNLSALCGDHIRRLGEIYRSLLPEPEKERAFEAGLRETADCVSCRERRAGRYLSPRMKAKICVVGEKSSEKSAVLAPFVLDNFDDRYIQTLGTAVSKKRLLVKDPGGSGQMELNLTVWNILGNRGYRELMKEAYFYGARGALCVVDGTRKSGLDVIDDWAALFEVNGKFPMAILVNTRGKSRDNVVEETEVAAKAKTYDAPYFYTSTKTGENVETALQILAERIVAGSRAERGAAGA